MAHVATVTIPAAASTLSNVPVLLTPDDNAGWDTFWSTVVNGGGDIRVYLDDDTTELAREVVSCDTTAETGEIWIKVPTVSSSVTTDIHIHADGSSSEPAAGSTYGSQAVWAGAHAVWHGGTTTDVTGNGYDLAASGTVGSGTGPWGDTDGAWDFGGSSYLSDTAAPVTNEPFSLSCWFNPDNATAFHTLMGLADDAGTGFWRIAAPGSVSGDPVRAHKQSEINTNAIADTSTGFSASAWNYAVGVFTSNTSRTAYLDGGGAQTDTTDATDATPDSITIGLTRPSGASQFMVGLIAHARIWKTALTADWIAYEYANQASPSTWYTLGGGSDTITLTDVTNRRVLQRDGSGVASLAVAGTYSGTPTTIQYRLVEHGTSTVVTGHDWQTLEASPSGGAFADTITGIPTGGWYNIQVRFSNDTGVTDEGVNRFGVGAIVGNIGQSHSENMNTDGTGTPNDLLSKYLGSWTAHGTTGSGDIALGNALITAIGGPVAIINGGVGGSAIGEWYTSGGGKQTNYTNWEANVTGAGGDLEAVIWWQGARDALLATSGATYNTELTALLAQLRTDYDASLPVMIGVLSSTAQASPVDEDWQAIRQAHLAVAAADANAYQVSPMELEKQVGDPHYTAASYATMGERFANVLDFLEGGSSYWRGPQLASAVKQSDTVVRVTLTHQGGTDFTPTTGITGFSALDGASAVTVNSAARVDATHIDLTLASAVTGDVTVRYQYGGAPDVSDPVLDNTAHALPLEPTAPTLTASDVGATYWEDFSGYTLGQNPIGNGWTQLGLSSVVALDTSEVVTNSLGQENRAWHIVENPALTGAHQALIYDAVTGSPDTVEIYLEMASATTDLYGIEAGGAAYVSGTSGSLNAYVGRPNRFNSTQHQRVINKFVAGSPSNLALSGAVTTPSQTAVWSVLTQILPESSDIRVRWKAWLRDSESEPGTWDQSALDDSSPLSAGNVGVWMKSLSNGGSYIFAVGVGVDGSDAPRAPSTGDNTPADSAHSHLAAAPTLTQAHTLTVNGSLHGQSAEGLTLDLATFVASSDSMHGQISGESALSSDVALTILNSVLDNSSEDLTLTQGDVLIAGDCLHGQESEEVGFVVAATLIVGNSSHGLISGEIEFDSHTLTTSVMRNNTGQLLANQTGVTLDVYDRSTGAHVVRYTSLTSDASGVVTVTDSAIGAADYIVVVRLPTGARGLERLTAT